MNYHETEQKMILREAERDILALLVVDPSSEEYEVIYSDEAYRRFENRYRRCNFFTAWAEIGVNLIHEPDRARMLQELSKEQLLAALNEDDIFLTRCRFIANDKPIWCQVKASWNPVEAGTIVISIRNIDRELRHEMDHMAELEELLRREAIYREAILANAAGYMEVNLTRNIITSRICDQFEGQQPIEPAFSEPDAPIPYDAFEAWWGQNMVLSDKEEFLSFCNCDYLLSRFERGNRICSIEFKAKTADGGVSICKATYYLSQDSYTGDVMAICVL